MIPRMPQPIITNIPIFPTYAGEAGSVHITNSITQTHIPIAAISLPPASLYGLFRSGSFLLKTIKARVSLNQQTMSATEVMLVSIPMMLGPRKGPIAEMIPQQMSANHGVPLFSCISENFAGSRLARPRPSISLDVAIKKAFHVVISPQSTPRRMKI